MCSPSTQVVHASQASASALSLKVPLVHPVHTWSATALPAALTWFKDVVSKFPGGVYEDNALYYEVRIYVDQVDCPTANVVLTDLQTRFPGGTYTIKAQDYAVLGGC